MASGQAKKQVFFRNSRQSSSQSLSNDSETNMLNTHYNSNDKNFKCNCYMMTQK